MMPWFPSRCLIAAAFGTLCAAPLAAQPTVDPPRTVPEMIERLSRPAPPEAARGRRIAQPGPAAGTTAPPGRPAVSILVRFATGSANLDASAQGDLAVLGRALASSAMAPYRIRVEGHTDTVGTAAFNQTLSELRAAAVRTYLVGSFGVPPDRLEAAGLGETQLLVPTPDERAEPWNRRVQVVNLGPAPGFPTTQAIP